MSLVEQCGFNVEALTLQPAPSRSDPLGHIGHVAVKFDGGLSAPFEGSHAAMVEAAQSLIAHVVERMVGALKVAAKPPAFIVDQGTGVVEPVVNTGSITVEELLRRGADTELEGRALDVVLRCGWPRPGDPLGIKPCIPIERRLIQHALAAIDLDDGRSPRVKLQAVRDFLDWHLKHQAYVMGLYLNAAAAASAVELPMTGS